ncbi:LysR family transcriptional regulator [Streptomyces spinosirectus]|jgi:DNA-binding transcriptional LysR family regulator|uniref:LysR family transcriptional regulator n=1 Tax=Streptomyces TaxID=1883 RepID=UPI001C9D9524|nr:MULTISPECIES: LysR family transcriptional regulator [Streptomyces]MBY8343453.1 LysR family transcriptional regulator [Streptomyces plumbidurans]UIR22550.1 LysR family transcriptional regulator [Streptomyces spinosirectus]
MPSLRALECLVAVADSGSVTHAARLLHSSQPAVSHQLAALEREVGTVLLHREPRGVKLTAAGRAAVADARRAIEAAASAVRSARAVGEATGGSLRLACAQSLVSVLAPVVREWHHRYPTVTITVRESTSAEEIHGFIDADEVDVVLMPAPVPDRFTATVVADEEIVLAAPTDHPLAGRPVVHIKDLDGVRLVHFAPDNGLGAWLDRSFTKAKVRPEPVMRTSVTVAAPQLAAAGLGVAVCPVSAISAGFPGAVRSFSPDWVRQLVAVTSTTADPLAARFIADMRRHGVHVPHDVRTQLGGDNSTPAKARPSS